jgi:hypothetical protein
LVALSGLALFALDVAVVFTGHTRGQNCRRYGSLITALFENNVVLIPVDAPAANIILVIGTRINVFHLVFGRVLYRADQEWNGMNWNENE